MRGEALIPAPSGSTRVACVLGWPAGHSLSPAIHNAGFAAAGLDWVYVACSVPPAAVGDALAGMRALGFAGANVTMPHKRAVMEFLDEVTPQAVRVGAVNTITNDAGRLIGDTTDGPGFLRFLTRDAGLDPAGCRTFILGAGGAARSVAAAMGDAGAVVRVTARKPDAAADVAALARGETVPWAERESEAGEAALIVNATPLGSEPGEPGPVSGRSVPSGCVVVDLLYAPPQTVLLREAAESGARTFNGTGMLVHQAILAFERWTGGPAPEAAMLAAVRAATTS